MQRKAKVGAVKGRVVEASSSAGATATLTGNAEGYRSFAQIAADNILIAQAARSEVARKGANAAHDKPGGSRERRDAIRAAWATGKYSSRNICAEEECAAHGISFATARKALIGTPNPT